MIKIKIFSVSLFLTALRKLFLKWVDECDTDGNKTISYLVLRVNKLPVKLPIKTM